jgi:capsular exopolysaccharide synthesis family protein
MSEIFSWLKRAELEKRKSSSESANRSVGVYPVDPDPSIIDLQTDSLAGEVEPAKIDIRSDARFDLAAADYRIRAVLDPQTLIGEQYRMLRAKLSQLQKQRGLKSLLVTSSVPVEGKTFTACCLAGVFAQEPGKRVLLIDADLRKPRVGYNLGMKDASLAEGLCQVLRGERQAEEVMLSSENLAFFLMPSGPVPDDPAELLSSPNLERTVRAMTAVFDWVVIDSPPVVGLADASLIAPFCDAALLVVHADKTPAKLAKESIERLGREKFCGIVLNRGKYVHASHYYYHYYHKSRNKGQ